MTPKEKADNLILKMQMKPMGIDFKVAKRCALIAVNEILEATKEAAFPMSGAAGFDYDNYWLDVMKEIENI